MRYWYHQRDSLVTIGEYPLFKLKVARDRRDEVRRLVANDIDPAALRAYEVTANERRLPNIRKASFIRRGLFARRTLCFFAAVLLFAECPNVR